MMHGRDHRPGGTDPIPGGTSLPACFVDGPLVTLSTWTPNVYTAVTWDLFETNDASSFAMPGSGGSSTVRHLTGGVFSATFAASFQPFTFPAAPGLFIYTIATLGHAREDVEFSINHTNAAWAEGNTNASGRAAPLLQSLFNYGFADDIVVNTAWTGSGTITFTPRMYVYRIGDHLV